MSRKTLAEKRKEKLTEYLDQYDITKGGGGEPGRYCSIQIINYVAGKQKIDDVTPPYMSKVIRNWIVYTQDAMPAEMRNSKGWKDGLIQVAYSGRQQEEAYLNIISDWLYEEVMQISKLISMAEYYKTDEEYWQKLCQERRPFSEEKDKWFQEMMRNSTPPSLLFLTAKLSWNAAKERERDNFAGASRYAALAAVKATEQDYPLPPNKELWTEINPVSVITKLAERTET